MVRFQTSCGYNRPTPAQTKFVFMLCTLHCNILQISASKITPRILLKILEYNDEGLIPNLTNIIKCEKGKDINAYKHSLPQLLAMNLFQNLRK